jgi:hypothetical protein
MKMQPENIERLLNGYIDGELTVRQQTEVKRLLGNDPEIAECLLQLRKCKMLVSSVPPAQAPPEMLDDVMARLARRSLLGEEPAAVNHKAGVRDLFLRKVLTAAAMIALVALFGTVVYTIVAPPAPVEQPSGRADTNRTATVINPPKTVLAKFNGRLELKTAAFMEMDASINRAVEDSDMVHAAGIERLGDKTIYVLTCARKGLNQLLNRMDNDWARLDSATLFVETDLFDQPVAVNAVTPKQITEITAQATFESTVRVAKDLAMFNNLSETLRSRAVLPTDNKIADLGGLDRPRLTRNGAIEKAIIDNPNVELVIVLTRSK